MDTTPPSFSVQQLTATVGTASAPPLLAVSRGLGLKYLDDNTLRERGMEIYDALYAWCGETEPRS